MSCAPLALVPNCFPEPLVSEHPPVVKRQKQISILFIMTSLCYSGYYLNQGAKNWTPVEYRTEIASLPLPLLYNSESHEKKEQKYGKVLTNYAKSLWKVHTPSPSGFSDSSEEITGVWNSQTRAAMPEIPLSFYLPKLPNRTASDPNADVDIEGFLHQSFSGPTACTEQLLTPEEFAMGERQPMVDMLTSTYTGISQYKVGAQDGSNTVDLRDFTFPSLVTKDLNVFTSRGRVDLTRITAKLCGISTSTQTPLYADYVRLVIPNPKTGPLKSLTSYSVDVAIDAPVSWGFQQDSSACGAEVRGGLDSDCPSRSVQQMIQPSMTFELKPGVDIIATMRLDILLSEYGFPIDGGYKLTPLGERERTLAGQPTLFDSMYEGTPILRGGHFGLTLELTEVNFIRTVRDEQDFWFYIFNLGSEIGGGLSIIASVCTGLLLLFCELKEREPKKDRKKDKREVEMVDVEIEVGELKYTENPTRGVN